jgi:hypothetical protein
MLIGVAEADAMGKGIVPCAISSSSTDTCIIDCIKLTFTLYIGFSNLIPNGDHVALQGHIVKYDARLESNQRFVDSSGLVQKGLGFNL